MPKVRPTCSQNSTLRRLLLLRGDAALGSLASDVVPHLNLARPIQPPPRTPMNGSMIDASSVEGNGADHTPVREIPQPLAGVRYQAPHTFSLPVCDLPTRAMSRMVSRLWVTKMDFAPSADPGTARVSTPGCCLVGLSPVSSFPPSTRLLRPLRMCLEIPGAASRRACSIGQWSCRLSLPGASTGR